MARSSDINQRIQLVGAEEVRRHLEQIAQAGERSGNQVRASLLAASQGVNSFTSGARSAGQSSGQMRFALQNLSFQVNDVATSLASGGDALRVFAQQGGQIFQVFQTGGGIRAVLGGAAAAIGAMITPMRVAGAAAVALGGAFAFLVARAVGAQASAREFDVVLRGLGKSSKTTGAALEDAARRLRDVGLNISEARTALNQAIREGVDPREAERIIRIGQDLNAVLGQGSLEKFISAAAKGGEPLREFARQLGIVRKEADDTSRDLEAAAEAALKFSRAIADAQRDQGKALADVERDKARQLDDAARQFARQRVASADASGQQLIELKRQQAQTEEDIELQSARRIEDINRAHAEALTQLAIQRNQQNAADLAAYNKRIATSAQEVAETGRALIDQIEARVKGLANEALGPGQRAMRDLGIAWLDLLDTLSKNEVVLALIRDFTNLIRVVSEAIRQISLARQLSGAAPLDLTSPAARAAFEGFAAGTARTPPGTILVGERGPELISQPGGLSVWPNGLTRQILSAFGSLNMPVMPRSRSFAAGTIGASAGSIGSPVYLTFSGGKTVGPMMADRQVKRALEREARRDAMLSAGKLPSTA